MTKRQFLKILSATTAVSSVSIDASLASVNHQTPNELARNEDFWAGIRQMYRLNPSYINLENGYYCLQAQPVLEKNIEHLRALNYSASRYMRTVQFDNKDKAREALSEMLGCAKGEVVITRNTTEGMDTIIAGLDWKPGDEAVMALQDYGAMLDMFKQQARRYGIINKTVSLPNHPQNDEEIVNLYEAAITPSTRLLMICHIVNITGQILPVKKIVAMAHAKGVPVVVDGAHAVGHIDFNIKDLDCDYYASSLHKWLGCPLGAGLLYVKKEKIASIWPLFGDSSFADDDIRKLNHTGTHPCHTDLTITDAIAFHQNIGIARKEARLRYLQTYWTSRVRNHSNIVVNTPKETQRACGIANVGIKHITPANLMKQLFNEHQIWTVAIDTANVQGLRITPHLYTSTEELEKFISVLLKLA